MINEAETIKIGLDIAYECFNLLDWQQKKEMFETDCMQNKMYEIPKVLECLDKYLQLHANLNEAIDKTFEKPVITLTDPDGFETEVK